MKIFIVSLVVIVSLFFFGRGQCSKKNNVVHNPPPPQSASTVVEVVSTNKGWSFTHHGSGYDWFIPTTQANQPTEWFITTNLNTTYRVKTTCMVEFRSVMDQKITAVKVVYPTGESYLNDQPFPEEKFLPVRIRCEAIRFRPLDGQKLEVKMGSTE